MSEPTPLAVVHAYLDAYTAGDIPTAAGYLAEDFRFSGPFATADNAAEFLGDPTSPGLTAWAANLTGLTMIAAMVEGDEVLAMYQVHTRGFGTLLTASHFTVNDGRIHEERIVFDTAPIRVVRAAHQPTPLP